MRSPKEKIRSRQRLECKRFRLPYSSDIFGEVDSDFHQAQRAGILKRSQVIFYTGLLGLILFNMYTQVKKNRFLSGESGRFDIV